MELSVKLKKRFCADCKIPIKIYDDPYFTERLKLLDPFYDTLKRFESFKEELKYYSNEKTYFEHCDKVQESAINAIKSSDAFVYFNADDMNKYAIMHKMIPQHDIFYMDNDNHLFISIDMKKANFTALKHYGDRIGHSAFLNKHTWEDFISHFTTDKHIIQSKYIRQIIFGHCNSKRIVTYEKFMMDTIINLINDQDARIINHTILNDNNIVSFVKDEIVYDVTEYDFDDCMTMRDMLSHLLPDDFKVTFFKLHAIGEHNTDGYYEEIFDKNNNSHIEFKGVNNNRLPFVIRNYLNESITEFDKTFIHEGLLARFIETPTYHIQKSVMIDSDLEKRINTLYDNLNKINRTDIENETAKILANIITQLDT